MPRSNSANSGIARCDARIDPLQNVCVARSGSGSIFSGPHAAESQAMTESRQSRYALERAQPVRYIVTAETLQHFQHLDCPAGPGYWSIGDGDASLAYYCPYCGARLAPPEVTPPAESSPGVSDKPQGPDSVGFLLACPVCSIEMEVDAVTQHAPRFRRCPHCATRLFVSKADHDHDAFPFPILTVVQHDLHFPLWFPVQV
jgi:DNA-directed RNA polymerase subunit RPC12/RpoP